MITLHTDDYFHIGATHLKTGKPCQDYSFSEKYDGAVFAGVSDGCSSGRNTDVGSRVLLLGTAVAVREHWIHTRDIKDEYVADEITLRQKMILTATCNTLGLTTEDMLATCLYTYLTCNYGYVSIQGDGVVALKEKSGRIVMRRYEWRNNTPFYPAYTNERLVAFMDVHGGDVNESPLTEETWVWNPDDSECINLGCYYHRLGDGINGITLELPQEYIKEDLAFVAVFSDGVTQIDGVLWQDAVKEFMAFKSTKGSFVKRRMIRGIADMQKVGKGPLDDIAVAVVRIEHPEKETEEDN